MSTVRGVREPLRLLALATALATALVVGLPAPAGADGEPRPPRPHAHKRHRSAEVLLDMKDALGAERAEGGIFRIRKRYGFEYAHRFDADGGDPPLIFSIQGPAMPRKRLGLSVEIRF